MLTGLTGFLPESTLTLYDNLEFLFRILLSAALGAAIGLERTKRQKEAGYGPTASLPAPRRCS